MDRVTRAQLRTFQDGSGITSFREKATSDAGHLLAPCIGDLPLLVKKESAHGRKLKMAQSVPVYTMKKVMVFHELINLRGESLQRTILL